MNGYDEILGRGNLTTTPIGGAGAQNSDSARVWLVDDNARFRSLLASLLIEEGGFDCEREFSKSHHSHDGSRFYDD